MCGGFYTARFTLEIKNDRARLVLELSTSQIYHFKVPFKPNNVEHYDFSYRDCFLIFIGLKY